MNNHVTFARTIQRLEENKLAYAVLPLQQGVTVILMERGGRVLGPFLSEDGDSLFWSHPAWNNAARFREFLAAHECNVGGERIGIAPELQYYIGDRANFEGTYCLPAQIDPGSYTLDQPSPNQWRMAQQITLEARNMARGTKTLDLEIVVRRIPDPLRGLAAHAALLDGVCYAGYEQIVTLAEHTHDDILSESWNLIQLNPGGQVIIPVSPCLEITDYQRGALPDPAHTIHQGRYLSVSITGDEKYKIGYKAAHLTGRLAYWNALDSSRAYLLVRSFTNNPSSIYIEEPAHRPGVIGDSVHIYNDSGQSGGFGEMECQGQTIGGASGQSTSTDRFQLWTYVGTPVRLKEIAAHLLGVEL